MARTGKAASPVAKGGAVLAGSLAVANALGYTLNLIASRRLGPQEFGAFAALMGIVLVANVGALALQSVSARRVVTDGPGAVAVLLRLGTNAAAVIGGVLAAASPLLASFLHVGVGQVLLVSLSMVPMTLVGAHLGLAQGGERFGALAVLYIAVSGGKMGGTLIGLLVRADVTAGLVGMLAGAAAAAVAAAWVTRRRPADAGAPPVPVAGVTGELLTAGAALFAFFGLTNVDVLLARHHLPSQQAGLYALGAVVAKGTFWLPQFVSVLAYPMFVDDTRRARAMRISVLVVSLAGVAACTGAALAPGIVVQALGGSAYARLEDQVWLFAAAGSLFALAQLLLYARLARGNRTAAVSVALAAFAVIVTVQAVAHGSVQEIVVTVCVAAAALCVAGLVSETRHHCSSVPLPSPP